MTNVSRGPIDKTAGRRDEQTRVATRLVEYVSTSLKKILEIYSHGEGFSSMDTHAIHKRAMTFFTVRPGDRRCCSVLKTLKKVLSEPLDSFFTEVDSWLSPFCASVRQGDYYGLVATLASIKKGCPDACSCSIETAKEKWKCGIVDPVSLPDGYLDYARKTTRRLFRRGWDNQYMSYVLSNSIPLGACTSSSRSSGGSFARMGYNDVADLACGNGEVADYQCNLTAVSSAGKTRVLVTTPVEWNSLRPLHKCIYSRLCREKWLLCGKPTPKRLRHVTDGMGKGEKLLSGDYESATDGLSIEVAEACLEEMFSVSAIPSSVKETALKCLRPLIKCSEKESIQLRRGQMMGSLLSFPLLCLQNYIATTWLLGNRPMLINGDDLLTRCSRREFCRWMTDLPRLGLKPSQAKTGFRRTFFTINSTYFRLTRGLPRPAAFFRAKCILKKEHSGLPEGDAFAESRGGVSGSIRIALYNRYVDFWRKQISCSNRRLVDLGLQRKWAEMPMWCVFREMGLRCFPDSYFRPIPPLPMGDITGLKLPAEAVRVPSRVLAAQPELRRSQGRLFAQWKDAMRSGFQPIDPSHPNTRARLEQMWDTWWTDLRVSGIRHSRVRGAQTRKFALSSAVPHVERIKESEERVFSSVFLLKKTPIKFKEGGVQKSDGELER